VFRLFKKSEEKELAKIYERFYRRRQRLLKEWVKKPKKLKGNGEELIDYIMDRLTEKKMEREKPLFLR